MELFCDIGTICEVNGPSCCASKGIARIVWLVMAGFGIATVGFGLAIVVFELATDFLEVGTDVFELETVVFELETAVFELETADIAQSAWIVSAGLARGCSLAALGIAHSSLLNGVGCGLAVVSLACFVFGVEPVLDTEVFKVTFDDCRNLLLILIGRALVFDFSVTT